MLAIATATDVQEVYRLGSTCDVGRRNQAFYALQVDSKLDGGLLRAKHIAQRGEVCTYPGDEIPCASGLKCTFIYKKDTTYTYKCKSAGIRINYNRCCNDMVGLTIYFLDSSVQDDKDDIWSHRNNNRRMTDLNLDRLMPLRQQ